MFRILSIDGGGMKGAFAAAFLDQIQTNLPLHIADYFDLIAGTSTGGILALALALGRSTKEVLDLYKTQGRAIFPSKVFPWWLLSGTKYESEGLRNVLIAHFGGLKLADAKTRLLIPSLEAHTGRVHIYKNAYHSRLKTDYRATAVDVAMATSAAPVYFPAHQSDSGIFLLDGAVWANNPAGIATAEAVGLLQIPCNEVQLLTVGTTDSPLGKLPTGFQWKKRMLYALNVAMAGQSSGSLGIAKTLIGGENVSRWSPTLAQGLVALDQCENLDVLESLGRAEGRRASTRLHDTFFSIPAEKFSPVYSLEPS
jgi:predicted acylesterase/phospholipase RssA